MPYSFRERVFWFSPLIPAPVDLDEYAVKPWQHHQGDSDIWLATAAGQIEYLLKTGTDAVSEMAYFALASYFDLPSQVVHWCQQSFNDRPTVAIRFEREAVYPQTISVAGSTATYNGDTIQLFNPHDFYAHLALNAVSRQMDSFEFMALDGILFRIDAAAGFDLSAYLSGRKHPPRIISNWCTRLLKEALSAEDKRKYWVLADTLRSFVDDDNVANVVRDAVLAGPVPSDLGHYLARFIRLHQREAEQSLEQPLEKNNE